MSWNTEADLLAKILQFRLHVDADTLAVHYYHEGRQRFYLKIPDQHPVSGRHRFRFGPRRATIYRNRLVWMYFHRRAIPVDMVVDHIDGDPLRDDPANLRLMSRSASYAQGQRVHQDRLLAGWEALFEFIDFMGHAPADNSPLWS